jgi:hypothetical protein
VRAKVNKANVEASQTGRTLRARRPPLADPDPDEDDELDDDDYQAAEDDEDDDESSSDEDFEEGTCDYVEPSRR